MRTYYHGTVKEYLQEQALPSGWLAPSRVGPTKSPRLYVTTSWEAAIAYAENASEHYEEVTGRSGTATVVIIRTARSSHYDLEGGGEELETIAEKRKHCLRYIRGGVPTSDIIRIHYV